MIETIPSRIAQSRPRGVEFETAEDFRLVASNPVMVGQFLAAEDAPE